MPPGVWDAWGFGVGEPALTGEPVGDALGAGVALAVGDGDGLGLAGVVLLAGGPHAIDRATVAARTVDIISDLLIVFLLR